MKTAPVTTFSPRARPLRLVTPRQKWIVWLSVVAGALALWSSTFCFEHFLGSGLLHLVAPPEAELRVQLDDQAEVVIPPATHGVLKVRRGAHTVVLRTHGEVATRSFQTSGGFWRALARAGSGQCFVLVDLTRSHPNVRHCEGSQTLPEIEHRYDAELVALSWLEDKIVFLADEDLPKSGRGVVKLVEQVSCEALRSSDEELLRDALGYEGRSRQEIKD